MTPPRNRLGDETSPYLLQHADNPVHWHAWGEEALAAAREQDKPILLSVGYSACHWCHVMAHESFEDEETATLMNERFVNIKVDREERPDLDKIYQTAHQLLTQRAGGWPLTMFLAADDQTPFFGGTYFPSDSRHGLPAFKDLLRNMAEAYRTKRDELRRQGAVVADILKRLNPEPAAPGTVLTREPINAARRELQASFDPRLGGFGGAPKFPHPTSLERLVRHWRDTAGGGEPDLRGLRMAVLTLQRMAEGGLYDQLGGGFCRYSVDPYWMIPHFEKMLYDNGPLLALSAQCWQVTDEPLYGRVAAETGGWVMREMQDPAGGYYSTLDADSEGEEGKFYVWEAEEVRDALDEAEFRVLAPVFGLDREPNFEGKWHLHTFRPLRDIADQLGVDEETAREQLDSGRAKLLALREGRIRPGRDEKILTSWNGLMIRGMAIAARILAREDLADSAARAVDFIRDRLWRGGRLLATYKDGRARFEAYLDDYAFLIDGLLELVQVRWRTLDLEFAVALAEVLLEHFEDREAGGFYFTADDHEELINRPKNFGDDATPSGNGIAAVVLGRLGHVLGEPRYLEAAERTLLAAWPAMGQQPQAYMSMISALEEHLSPVETVIVRGEQGELAEWRRAASRVYAPRRLVFAIPASESDLPGALAARAARQSTVAYVCHGTQCSAPVESLEALEQALAQVPEASSAQTS